MTLDWHDDAAMTVVMAAQGYPGAYDKGTAINGLDNVNDATMVFHAGTARAEDGDNYRYRWARIERHGARQNSGASASERLCWRQCD